jgi:hypothetical protein
VNVERDAGESIAQPLLDERYGKVGVERRTLTMACNNRQIEELLSDTRGQPDDASGA